MADDLSEKGWKDATRINTHEDYEVRYWSEKFGVSAKELTAAIQKFGNSAKAVQKELRG